MGMVHPKALDLLTLRTWMMPGWRPNGIRNPVRPAPQPIPAALGFGVPYAPQSQRATHSLASSKDSSNQQRAGQVKYDANGHPCDVDNESTGAQPNLVAARDGAKGSEGLSTLLTSASPEEQKQILGERLYPLVGSHQPNLATKVTGMLLAMENSEILLLLDSPNSLVSKVEEAVEVLKLSKSKVPNQDSLHSNYRSAEITIN